MNIANDIEDLYTEDYISLVSRVKDLNKWQEIPCSSIRNLVLLMWQHSPSWSNSHAIAVEISASPFTEIDNWCLNSGIKLDDIRVTNCSKK
jgi:hypothetical protein